MDYIGEFNWTDYVGPYAKTKIYAITKNGELKWKHEVPGQASLELLNNTTLLVNAGPKLFNFGLNGKKLWEYTAFEEEEDSYEPYIETVVFENVIYGKSSKAMFALDFDGKEKWMKKTEGLYLYQLTEGNTNVLVYESSDENGLPILNAMTLDGKQAWSYNIDVPYNEYNDYNFDIYPTEQSLFVATEKGLTKVSIEGKVEYTVKIEGYISEFIPTSEVGHIAVSDFTTNTYTINTFDLNSGKILNSSTLTDYPTSVTSDEQNNLYFGSENLLYMKKADDSSETETYTPWKKQFEDVVTNKTWNINFNKVLNENTINENTISITLLGEETKVPPDFQLSQDKKRVTITPSELYENGQTYQLKIKGVESLAGRKLSPPIVMTFTVKAE